MGIPVLSPYPLRPVSANPDRAVVAELARRLHQGEEVVLATAVRTEGAPPCRPGQKLLLSPTGPLAGTLGCSELDSQAVGITGEVLASGMPGLRMLDHDLGRVEAYFEPYATRPLLVVLGATPVAAWLLRWAPGLGYDTVLVEPRGDRVTPELAELAGASVSSPADCVFPESSSFDAVHTDHDAPMLAEHLATLLDRGCRFVGVMGSARHVGHHLAALRQMGVPESAVCAVRSPVGLDIGGRTPAEIALSILAGLIAARTGRSGGWLDAQPPGAPAHTPTSASD